MDVETIDLEDSWPDDPGVAPALPVDSDEQNFNPMNPIPKIDHT